MKLNMIQTSKEEFLKEGGSIDFIKNTTKNTIAIFTHYKYGSIIINKTIDDLKETGCKIKYPKMELFNYVLKIGLLSMDQERMRLLKIDRLKLNEEQIYHLIDLLEIDNQNTKFKTLMSDNQKKEATKYNNKIIKKLKGELK